MCADLRPAAIHPWTSATSVSAASTAHYIGGSLAACTVGQQRSLPEVAAHVCGRLRAGPLAATNAFQHGLSQAGQL